MCWYWKFLAEADEVWMPKAARLHWFMTAEDYRAAPPDPLCASNLWKRYYLAKIRELQVMRPNLVRLLRNFEKKIKKWDYFFVL